jgi:hypothetical protein
MAKKHDVGPQKRFKWGGYGSVWRWAKGHGIHRWIKARNWARRRVKQAKDPKGFKKAEAAYAKKVKWIREHRDPNPPKGNFVSMDGKQVAGWIGRIALQARSRGAWGGTLISGYRSPEYSTSICIGICGHPICSGTCAGANSNHSCPPTHTCKPYEGAGDFTDAARLCAYARSQGVPLHGGGEFLPNDINHCSYSGR